MGPREAFKLMVTLGIEMQAQRTEDGKGRHHNFAVQKYYAKQESKVHVTDNDCSGHHGPLICGIGRAPELCRIKVGGANKCKALASSS